MKIIVHTERGIFTSVDSKNTPTKENMENLMDVMKEVVKNGSYFDMDTENGKMLIGKELLKTAVFFIKS